MAYRNFVCSKCLQDYNSYRGRGSTVCQCAGLGVAAAMAVVEKESRLASLKTSEALLRYCR